MFNSVTHCHCQTDTDTDTTTDPHPPYFLITDDIFNNPTVRSPLFCSRAALATTVTIPFL